MFLNSFPEKTKIKLANDLCKNIEEIKENDLVLSFNIKNNEFEYKKVLKVFTNYINEFFEIETYDNAMIKTSLDHPFLTENGWKNACLLTEDDVLLKEKNKNIHKTKIKSLNFFENFIAYEFYGKQKVYNIIIEDNNNYIANGFIVHS